MKTIRNFLFIIISALFASFVLCVIGKVWCLAINLLDVAKIWDIASTIIELCLISFMLIYIYRYFSLKAFIEDNTDYDDKR